MDKENAKKTFALFYAGAWHENEFDTIQDAYDYAKARGFNEYGVYPTGAERVGDVLAWKDKGKPYLGIDPNACKGITLCF